MNNITTRGATDLTDVTRVSVSDEESEKCALHSGDCLFNTRKSFEMGGKTAVWEEADELFIFNNNVMRIWFNEQVESRLVNEAFISPVIANQLLEFKADNKRLRALLENLREVRSRPAAGGATPDRGRAGRVASGSGRAEAPAHRDCRRVGCVSARLPRPRLQRRIVSRKRASPTQ